MINIILIIIYSIFISSGHFFVPFEVSFICTIDYSKCTKEEMEYLSIAELHDQIDDDKNGNIDITESKDFVKQSLASSRGSEKAKRFHKNDAQIDKQDLWHIWRTSEVCNWTVDDLLLWLSSEVKLPQYIHLFTNLKLNGSSLPRLTGNDYLMNVVGISNSIHRKKIIIKAVDAVLFGPSKDYRFAIKWVILSFTLILILMIYLCVQSLYSKQYVKDLQKKLNSLKERESSLSELRKKIKEAEDIKQMKDNEIQEMQERHKFELSSKMSYSHESLCEDSEKLQHAYKEIARLKADLADSQLQMNKLTGKKGEHSIISQDNNERHVLQSLLQLTHAIERQNLTEKIALIDHQSQEFIEMNEKVKKRKSGFMGSFRLIHSSDLDELEKGFASTKNAYETLILEKNEQESRWNKLESLIGLSLAPSSESSNIIQTIRWSTYTQSNLEPISSTASNLCHKTNALDKSQHKSSQEKLFDISPDLSIPKDFTSQESMDSSKTSSSLDRPTSEQIEVKIRSRKDFSDKRRPIFGVGRTRIASLNRSVKKNM